MTIMAGSSQLQTHRNKNKRDSDTRSSRSKSRNEIIHHQDTESESSGSPINEFSNMSTYRVPAKSRGNPQTNPTFIALHKSIFYFIPYHLKLYQFLKQF